MTEKEDINNIAEVYLLKTGLVNLGTPPKGLDYIAYNKTSPTKMIGVEVKQIDYSKQNAEKMFSQCKDTLSLLSREQNLPIVLFMVDKKTEKGFFMVFQNDVVTQLQALKTDTLVKYLNSLFGISQPVEFPPYKFFQRANESKYETWPVDVDEKFVMLRLFNVILDPLKAKENLVLEIEIKGYNFEKSEKISLHDRFYNPKLKNYLFFVKGNIAHTDIPLPPGRKRVTFKLTTTEDLAQFECTLGCSWLTLQESKKIEKF